VLGSTGAPRALTLALVVASAGLVGCVGAEQAAPAAAEAAECSDASGASSQPGSFSYGGAVSCKTDEESHSWDNQASQAQVKHGSSITQGEIHVTVEDAANRTVYEATVDEEGQGRQTTTDRGLPSASGVGEWTVALEFRNVTGTLGLELTSTS
jgi:hypothetical protein